MIDLRPLANLDFWFNLEPGALSPSMEQFFFVFFGAFVILGAVVRVVARHKKKDDKYAVLIYRKVGQLLLTMGILGMLFFFFTFEEAYFLGARFWFLLWGIGVIAWAASIFRFARTTVPAMRERHQKGKENERYLPRKS